MMSKVIGVGPSAEEVLPCRLFVFMDGSFAVVLTIPLEAIAKLTTVNSEPFLLTWELNSLCQLA